MRTSRRSRPADEHDPDRPADRPRHHGTPLDPGARDRLIRRARTLSWLALAYMTAEGAIALTAAILAGSIALLGFGLDSAIEALASIIVIWRFTRSRRVSQDAECRAERLAAISFFLFAPYLAQDAIRTLIAGRHPHASWLGIGVSISSIIVMPLLGNAKHRIGERLGSTRPPAKAPKTCSAPTSPPACSQASRSTRSSGPGGPIPPQHSPSPRSPSRKAGKPGKAKAAAPNRRSPTNTSPDATTTAADENPHRSNIAINGTQRANGLCGAEFAHLGQDPLDLGVLRLQMLLDVKSGVQHGIGVLIRGLGPLVGSSSENVLADDDDAQQHQLEKRLADP
jgi:hypothetical protein